MNSDGYSDINDDNKTPNQLSQLFIFRPGYPRFSYALTWRGYRYDIVVLCRHVGTNVSLHLRQVWNTTTLY